MSVAEAVPAASAYTRIEVAPLTTAIGAEIRGVDLSRPLDEATLAEIRRAWLDRQVVFFRDQDLTSKRFLEVAGLFGEPVEYPFVKGLDDFPLIIPVLKLAHETVNFGGVWHSDTAYMARPPMATMLYAQEIPPVGGDTLFASMYAAWEGLSDGLRATLAPLRAINSAKAAAASKTREDRIGSHGRAADGVPDEVAHPVGRVHPETGRRALYVNPGHTVRFEGWTEAESRPLLEYLFRQQIREEIVCRFRWQPGSIALWDNRCAQHYPVNDYHGHRRLLHRITLAGDVPA